MVADLKDVNIGQAFGQLLRGQEVDLPVEKKNKLGALFVTMFGMEPTHAAKSMSHQRDLVHAMMATDLLERGAVAPESCLPASPVVPWP